MFSYYDTDYPESDMIRFFGAGMTGTATLDVRYRRRATGRTITLFEIVSMVFGSTNRPFLFVGRDAQYLYDNFAQ